MDAPPTPTLLAPTHTMPKKPPKGAAASAQNATPASLLRDAEAALETGERRMRNGEADKAIAYFQTCCGTLEGMRNDRQACLLFATAMANLVELKAPTWSSSTADLPDLRVAVTALERGHEAAVGAGAPNDERAHLLSSLAECAGLLMDHLSLIGEWTDAVHWAAEAAKHWEAALALELAASEFEKPEASVETLCSLGTASIAFGKLALTKGSNSGTKTEALDASTRRAAMAAVKRALDAFEEACGLCDSNRGDDLPDCLGQWAQALWDASEIAPPHRRLELLERAADRAATSVRLQKVPVREATCLLGDVLVALSEHVWKARSDEDEVGAAARAALWHCRRALQEGYGEALRVRGRDLMVQCGMADALLDIGRLQREMLACGVDLTLAQPPPPTAVEPAAEEEVVAEAEEEEEEEGMVDLADAVDQMQVDKEEEEMDEEAAPLAAEQQTLVKEQLDAPASLPPLPPPADCLERAASFYAEALGQASAAEWAAARVSRLDVTYNAACACALRGGQEEDCAKLLGTLAAEGALRRSELEGDVDLAPLVPTAWMQSILSGLPP